MTFQKEQFRNKFPVLYHCALDYVRALQAQVMDALNPELAIAKNEALDVFIDQLDCDGIPYSDREHASRIAVSVASGQGLPKPASIIGAYDYAVERLQATLTHYGYTNVHVMSFQERQEDMSSDELETLLEISIKAWHRSSGIKAVISIPTQEVTFRAHLDYEIIETIMAKLTEQIASEIAKSLRPSCYTT